MKLSDEDLAEIERLQATYHSSRLASIAIGYEAGLRAGLELAAKVCDICALSPYRNTHHAENCAVAIRALAGDDPPK